tara:strand:- start:334 stop:483 length:150 start_codon:yes stop_codon:yes gene_type:complete
MKVDPNWVLVSGFLLLGTLTAVVIGAAGFLFFSGYHSGSTQCPKPALIK